MKQSLTFQKNQVKNIEDRVFEKLRINTDQLYEIANLNKNDEINTSTEILEKTVQRLLNEKVYWCSKSSCRSRNE